MESRRPIKKIALVILSILVCALFAGAILLHHFWPFTEGSVRSRLAETLSANVKFGSFHEKYFPPGCIAENVSFQRNGSGPPLISIRRLTIRSSLLRLLGHRISLLRAEGMHVTLARSDFSRNKSSDQQTTVDKFVADGTLPAVKDRLPKEPAVYMTTGMKDGIGEYGDLWRGFSACRNPTGCPGFPAGPD